jgi:cytochrome bd-type quinol oxidase subunit 2
MWNFSALQVLDPHSLPKTNDSALQTLLTDFFIVLGALSILMIVIAGVRYIFARGNAESTAKAKSMIAYSVIGLIIAALAGSIVSVVLNRAG